MRQCLDLYVSLVCRLHREYIVAFFFLLFFLGGGRGVLVFVLVVLFCFLFFLFVFVSLFVSLFFSSFFLFVLSVCLVLFVNCFL